MFWPQGGTARTRSGLQAAQDLTQNPGGFTQRHIPETEIVLAPDDSLMFGMPEADGVALDRVIVPPLSGVPNVRCHPGWRLADCWSSRPPGGLPHKGPVSP